jgi:hypothetical protein
MPHGVPEIDTTAEQTLSVIIPARNAAHVLPALLDDILELSMPARLATIFSYALFARQKNSIPRAILAGSEEVSPRRTRRMRRSVSCGTDITPFRPSQKSQQKIIS